LWDVSVWDRDTWDTFAEAEPAIIRLNGFYALYEPGGFM
jgi:hypothetical protein